MFNTSQMQKMFFFLSIFTMFVGCSSSGSGDTGLVEQDRPAQLIDGPIDESRIGGTGGDIPPDEGIVGTGGIPHDDGGIGGTGGGLPDDDGAINIEVYGSVNLGPVIGATVSVYDIDDIENEICETKTATTYLHEGESKDLFAAKSLSKEVYDSIGAFVIPADCPLFEDKLYLIAATGGFDIDIDDDGLLNNDDPIIEKFSTLRRFHITSKQEPTPVKGVVRILITGEQMLEEGWKVSALTEAVFEAVQFSVLNDESIDDILETLDWLAPLVLVAGEDEVLSSIDIIRWDPNENNEGHRELLMTPEQLVDFLTSIHAGKNAAVGSIAPYVGLVSHTNTYASANDIKVENNIAYVVTPSALILIDVKKPRSPKVIGLYPAGRVNEILVEDAIVYMATAAQGIVVLDASDPTRPEILARKSELYNASSLTLVDGVLYSLTKNRMHDEAYLNAFSSADDYQAVSSFLIQKSSVPVRKDRIGLANCGAAYYGPGMEASSGYALTVTNSHAYVSVNRTVVDGFSNNFEVTDLHIVDVTDYLNPVEVSVIDWDEFEVSHITNSYYADQLNPVCGLDNLILIGLAAPKIDAYLSTYLWGNYKFEGMQAREDRMYVPVKGTQILEYAVFDLSDPLVPVRLSVNFKTGCNAAAIGAVEFLDQYIVVECMGQFKVFNKETLTSIKLVNLPVFRGFVAWMYESLSWVVKGYTGSYLSADLAQFAFDWFLAIFFGDNVAVGKIWGEMDIANFDADENYLYLAAKNHGLQIVRLPPL